MNKSQYSLDAAPTEDCGQLCSSVLSWQWYTWSQIKLLFSRQWVPSQVNTQFSETKNTYYQYWCHGFKHSNMYNLYTSKKSFLGFFQQYNFLYSVDIKLWMKIKTMIRQTIDIVINTIYSRVIVYCSVAIFNLWTFDLRSFSTILFWSI